MAIHYIEQTKQYIVSGGSVSLKGDGTPTTLVERGFRTPSGQPYFEVLRYRIQTASGTFPQKLRPAANTPPSNSVPTSQFCYRNLPLTFSSGAATLNAITIADTDVSTEAVNVKLTLPNTIGNITLSGTSGLTMLVGNGTANETMQFEGTIARVNACLEGSYFNPPTGFVGDLVLELETNDKGTSGFGGPRNRYTAIPIQVRNPLLDSHTDVVIVQTGNIAHSGAPLVTGLPTGARVLLAGETNRVDNGIFVANISGTGINYARATDADASAELMFGSYVSISSGSHAGETWYLSGTSGTPLVPGTTAHVWEQF